MNWDTITLYQFQQIAKIKAGAEDTVADVNSKVLAILMEVSERVVDSMPLPVFIAKCKELSFLEDQVPTAKPKQIIKINGRRYRFVYDVQKIHFARYIESKEFSKDFIGNMHKAAASMVEPMHRWLPIKLKYDADKHNQYAEDMQQAKFVDVYNAVTFFFALYKNWISNSLPFLPITTPTQRESLTSLSRILDGFSHASVWQNLKK